MIIDFHTHTFPDRIAASTVSLLAARAHIRPFSDATQSGLLSSMKTAGIDGSVILPVATAPRQVAHINDSSALINRTFLNEDGTAAESPFLISLGCMHPELENWEEELERIASMGLLGIKIHPIYQGIRLDDPRFVRILKKCGQLGLIVCAHAGDDIGFPGVVKCSPEMARRALDEAGEVTMVLAHMGGWRNWEDVPKYLKDTQAYIDTSFSTGMIPGEEGFYKKEDLPMLDQEGFMRILDAFGCERVLLGSDSPWSDQAASLEWIRALPLSDSQKEAVSGGNAERLLHLR